MSQRFRYGADGTWFKGNTHIHSNRSDGGHDVREIARLYADAGYHFLCRTDHWVASAVASEGGDEPLVWIDGVELDGTDENGCYYHVVCLGTLTGIERNLGFSRGLQACRDQGALLILAHPFWTGNSLEDALQHEFDGVEVYNHVCHWLNGKSHGGAHWHAMLQAGRNALGIAADDAHLRPEHPGWNGGWVMVNAPDCTASALLDALREGRFYSTRGPEFLRMKLVHGRRVRVMTSPVRFIRLVGPGLLGQRRGAFEGPLLVEAEFDVPESWPYAILEIEDGAGKLAWTNSLFV